MLHSTEIFHEIKEHASSHGIVYKGLEHSLSALMKKKDGVVSQLGKGVRALVTRRVTCLEGIARIVGGERIEISEGKSIVIPQRIICNGSSRSITLFAVRQHIVQSDHGIAFDEVESGGH